MRIWLPGLFLTAAFWFLCLHGIDQPPTLVFDEFHYIPAAENFLTSQTQLNREHPPLGKILIAEGMTLAGDSPIGWRLSASIFGALTVLGIYAWGLVLYESSSAALFAGILTAANQLVFVQSRIAMLDTFMTGFLVWAAVLFCVWWRNPRQSRALVTSGILLGLACATKWFALIPLAFCGLLVAWQAWRRKTSLGSVGFFSLAVFFSYAVWFSPSSFVDDQLAIWIGQHNVPGDHPYASAWWSWPLQLRPIWYFFEKLGPDDLVRGIVLIGNPVVLYSGLSALVVCVKRAVREKSWPAQVILASYALCLLSWLVIPRKLTMFYYYYPAALILGLAWAEACRNERWRWAWTVAAIACFAYFYPVLSAQPIHQSDLGAWAWFRNWY